MGKKSGLKYVHNRIGDIIKVEIRDETRRLIYRNTFNIRDKNAILFFLKTLETYSGFSIIDLIYEKMKIGEWF